MCGAAASKAFKTSYLSQLGELQEDLEEFSSRRVEIWAISPDPPDKLAQYASEDGIEYALHSDANRITIPALGIVSPKASKVPHPTAPVVDGEGVVRYLRQDVDSKKRPLVSEILDAVENLD